MSSITIDTHKTIQNLQRKGFSLEQAEGVVEALAESALVTKSDLTTEITQLRGDIYKAMLIQTGAIAAIVFGMLQFIV